MVDHQVDFLNKIPPKNQVSANMLRKFHEICISFVYRFVLHYLNYHL